MTRPLVPTCQKVIQDFCGVNFPAVFLDVHGTCGRVGVTKSKKNNVQAEVAMNLLQRFVDVGVSESKILLLSPIRRTRASSPIF